MEFIWLAKGKQMLERWHQLPRILPISWLAAHTEIL